ncbi:hypothetical protein NWF24_30865 [Variovorax paradoxus]|uniref:hypothetical protein n=1 Tax=Variovorax paradoxus TaxID=34073 RepID=UPI0021ABD341|nr:hypothetical protein [Variovorax paradoxus]UVH57192.1 hypothetical protein NWF24_30865 [Variovorax paradoxus]
MTTCWICGEAATTHEHMIKASDVKAVMGLNVTQKSPLFFHQADRRNQPVGSIKSGKLKYNTPICAYCNHQRTQPHDVAWEKLSQGLRSYDPPIRSGTMVRLGGIFSGGVRDGMLGAHLFFLKLFGCLIVEHTIPIEIEPFSHAILNGMPHPRVRIVFGTRASAQTQRRLARTPVNAYLVDGELAWAHWEYEVDRLIVRIIYLGTEKLHPPVANSWHPSTMRNYLRIAGF